MTGPKATEEVAVFLDRDGVINRKAPEGDYIKSWGEFLFLPGVARAIAFLRDHGFRIFIVTNQRGVARGLMALDDLENIHRSMISVLEERGALIDGIYSCTHNHSERCDCRKPRPGLLIRAAAEHDIDLKRSWMVGDRVSDVDAGLAAGCRAVLLQSAPSPEGQGETRGSLVLVAQDLSAAARIIIDTLDKNSS